MPVVVRFTEKTKIVYFLHLFLKNDLLLNHFITLLKIAMYFKWFFDIGPFEHIKDGYFLSYYADCTFLIHEEFKKVKKGIFFLNILKCTYNAFRGNSFFP